MAPSTPKRLATGAKDFVKRHTPSPKKKRSGKQRLPDERSNDTVPKPPKKLPDWTLGVEFEFVLLRRLESRYIYELTDEEQSQDFASNKIRDALSNQPLTPTCSHCSEPTSLNLPLVCGHDYGGSFDKWAIDGDITVDGTPEEQLQLGRVLESCQFWGVEIKSRKLSLNKPLQIPGRCLHNRDYHEISYSAEITAVLDRLRSAFCFGGEMHDPLYYLYSNSTCGFHVHIGNERLSFPFQLVQKLVCLFIACERQIDGLHSIDRIVGTNLITRVFQPKSIARRERGSWLINKEVYNRPLSVYFMVDAPNRRQREYIEREYHGGVKRPTKDQCRSRIYPEHLFNHDSVWDARLGNDIDSWITLVEKAPDLKALLDLYRNSGRLCTLNLSNLPLDDLDDRDTYKCTIEFRQHKSTLNPKAALNFVDFLVHLLQFCDSHSPRDMMLLICHGGDFQRPDFSTLDLCERTGSSESTILYYKQQLDPETSDRTFQHLGEGEARDAADQGDPIGSFILHTIQQQRMNADPVAIRKHIIRKLCCGGYGQFEGATLDAILPPNTTETIRESLRIGGDNDQVSHDDASSKGNCRALQNFRTSVLAHDPVTESSSPKHQDPSLRDARAYLTPTQRFDQMIADSVNQPPGVPTEYKGFVLVKGTAASFEFESHEPGSITIVKAIVVGPRAFYKLESDDQDEVLIERKET